MHDSAGGTAPVTIRPGGAVLVVGGGTMGAGIAQVLLQAGQQVTVCEPTAEAAGSARARVARGLERAGATDALDRLQVVVGIPQGVDVALVVEAVPENEGLKRDVLGAVEAQVPPGALIATNTSSMSVGGLAGALSAPQRFIGMHFFNPVPRSALVEIVVGPDTAMATVEAARAWVRAIGKEEIVVKDSPGFATSRLGLAVGLEAIRMLEEGVASAEDIDRGMVLGYRFPIGPLALGDLVGLDVRLAVAEYLADTLGERFRPPQLLRDMVARGELGKKAGKGFFVYDERDGRQGGWRQ